MKRMRQTENGFRRVATLMMMGLYLATHATAQETATPKSRVEGKSQLEVTVGMAGFIEQIVLPGTELTVREVNSRRTPVAIRMDRVYPHGDAFRYDITFFGLEPGTHNLSAYLVRKDGTSTDDLPEISITVNSILPVDQITPHLTENDMLARPGGYRTVVALSTVLWILGLMAILFVGRSRKATAKQEVQERRLAPVDQIRFLVDRARKVGELSVTDKARLETTVLEFWRKKRNLHEVSVSTALAELKKDPEAGPLLSGIERWFYSCRLPAPEEISALLEPLAELRSDDDSTNPAVRVTS